MKRKNGQISEFNTLEEERSYWESRGPLAKGKRAILNRPQTRGQRSSFLSVRLSGKELTAWRDLAAQCGTGPSTLARNLILALVHQIENAGPAKTGVDQQTVSLEQVCQLLKLNMPGYSDQAERLLRSMLVGDTNNPQALFMDPKQLHEYLRLSALMLAKTFEIANPNLKVVVPPEILDGSAFQKPADGTQAVAANKGR